MSPGPNPPPSVRCLVCSDPEESYLDFDDLKSPGPGGFPLLGNNSESQTEAFEAFCHYLDKDKRVVEDSYKFNFTSDPFPFCRKCAKSLFKLNDFHQQVQGLLKQIQEIVTALTTDMIATWRKTGNSEGKSQDNQIVDESVLTESQKESKDNPKDALSTAFPVEKIRYYRCRIYSCCIPEYKISAEDRSVSQSSQLKKSRLGKRRSNRYSTPKYVIESDEEVQGTQGDREKDPEFRSNCKLPTTGTAEDDDTEFCDTNLVQSCLEQSLTVEDEEPIKRKSRKCNFYKNRVVQMGTNLYVFDSKRSFELGEDKVWKCLQCSYKSRNKFFLFQHFRRPEFLPLCSGKAPEDAVKEFKYHDFSYDQNKDLRYECRLCPFQADSEDLMKIHFDTRHSGPKSRPKRIKPKKKKTKPTDFNQRYPCALCPATFRTLKIAKQHAKFQHDKNRGNHVCDTCGRTFSTIVSLSLHQKNLHTEGEKTFKCTLCDKAFVTAGLLRTHFVSKHGEKNFMCESCGAAFTTLHKLNKHSRSHTKIICEICGETRTPNTIKEHLLSHSGGMWECESCDKKFKHASSLKSHQKCCGGVRPFACDLCGKKYTAVSSLNIHKQNIHRVTKTGEIYVPQPKTTKVYTCEQCGKEYLHQSTLCHHRKSCGGIKPYACDLCDKKFKCRHSIKYHKEKKHGIIAPPNEKDDNDAPGN